MATLVASSSVARALIARWYVTVPGLLVSLALATAGFLLSTPQFASNSTLVLTPAARHGGNSLLDFDPGMTTSAQIIVQTMNDPQMEQELELNDDEEVTVVNGSTNLKGKVVEAAGPFITVSSLSSSASRATGRATQATARIEQELTDLQRSVKVQSRQSMTLTPVLSPTPGKRVWDKTLRTAGLLMLLGCGTTLGLACRADRKAGRRPTQAREAVPTAAAQPSLDPMPHADAIESGIAYLAYRKRIESADGPAPRVITRFPQAFLDRNPDAGSIAKLDDGSAPPD